MDLQNAQFTNVPPPKASDGLDGSQTGKDGGNGELGKPSPNIKITAGQLLQGSSKKVNYKSLGGEGGNGGNGKPGNPGVSETGLVPDTCPKLILWPGTENYRENIDHEQVCCNDCTRVCLLHTFQQLH